MESGSIVGRVPGFTDSGENRAFCHSHVVPCRKQEYFSELTPCLNNPMNYINKFNYRILRTIEGRMFRVSSSIPVVFLVFLSSPLFARNEPLTYDKMKNIIKNEIVEGHPIESIEDLMNYFKSNSYPIVENNAFVHHSRSLQNSSFDFPRVILYSGDGELIDPQQDYIGRTSNLFLAFAGDPSSPASNRLEAIGFEPGTDTFQFGEAVFPGKGRPVQFSEAPKSCVTCHQGHPIWDSYKVWAGVYGGADDCLADATESAAYHQFQSKNARVGRYKSLKIKDLESAETSDCRPDEERFMHNTALGVVLGQQNGLRVATEIGCLMLSVQHG